MSDRRAASDTDAARPVPVVLGPNRPAERPYLGGEGILRFRHLPASTDPGAERMPEDFVASVTEVFAGGGVGLTTLENGTLLRDAIAADPVGYLGDEHVRAFGADPRLLVKLLDTRERLFVHYHPTSPFARDVLARDYGKTEAWIVVSCDGPGHAYLGFVRDVGEQELLGWFERQDVQAMLAAMHRVELAPGDTLYVPAGMPHSIGPGVTLVELQQPVDLSILVEYQGRPGLDRDAALLGLDPTVALSDLDRSAVAPTRIEELSSSRPERALRGGSVSDGPGADGPGADASSPAARSTELFPVEADACFRAERVVVRTLSTFAPAFSVLVVLEEEGELEWSDGVVPLSAGGTVLVPHGVGETTVHGAVTLLRCRPPAP